MDTAPSTHLHEMLKGFHVGMIVTRAEDGELRARPMMLAETPADETLWFMTDRNSGKMDEITHDNRVNVTMQSSNKFISISGSATAVEDRQKIAELWKEPFKVWFPGGKDDPSLVLIQVRGQTCEYWDNSGMSGIQYLIEAGKAYLSGTRPHLANDTKVHGKVHL
ncbi:pyridoxamine 5'-phosphate oxidase family protein [Schlesneria paludicola]|uniref:pyridoxamine 5'-phosphate oxidase family protein n=1 Tax=Schlesneria paludicola TaxID=360056 RepID=UPI00058D8113|nr:pyridoxamine 5'-phosphate oxidase family protein [Schlesneria paludicola]